MRRTVVSSITPTSRGLSIMTTVFEDGKRVQSKTTTRIWGRGQAHKQLDKLLFDMVAGQQNSLVREWMDQGELPF